MSSITLAPESQIKGKTAIITGGTKHLGGETARELAKLEPIYSCIIDWMQIKQKLSNKN